MILLIYGAGGLGKEVYDLVMRSTPDKYKKVYFIDDFADEGPCYLSEAIHFDSIAVRFKDKLDELEGVVGVGEPQHREMLAQKFISTGIRLATLIDKSAIISPTAKIGEGTIVCEHASLHSNVVIGSGCLVQPLATIGHDIRVGDYSVMGPHCAPGGGSVFGKRVFVGMHGTIKEKTNIGDDAIIGMGAVVYKDVEAGATVIGNPARVTRGNVEHKVFK